MSKKAKIIEKLVLQIKADKCSYNHLDDYPPQIKAKKDRLAHRIELAEEAIEALSDEPVQTDVAEVEAGRNDNGACRVAQRQRGESMNFSKEHRSNFVSHMDAHNDETTPDGAWWFMLEQAAEEYFEKNKITWADGNDGVHYYLKLKGNI